MSDVVHAVSILGDNSLCPKKLTVDYALKLN